MSRSTFIPTITSDDVLKASSNGLDIFERELGNINPNKNISNPFKTDSNPSARVKPSRTSGIWILTCYNDDGWTGNAISFLQRMYNLSYQEAIDKAAWDLGLLKKSGNNYKKVEVVSIAKPIIESKPILYEFEETKFKKKHHLYWNSGHLYEDFLREYGIYASEKIAVNKKIIKIPSDELCFVYTVPDHNGIKILRIGPNVDKADKWRTNIENSYIFGFSDIKETIKGNLWVIKSRKDEMIAKVLGLNTVSTQSENAVILDGNMERLLPLAEDLVINFGSDSQGVSTCKTVQQKYNTKYYNTPKNLLPTVNDLFSYSQFFGLKSLENNIKNKKLL